ncbi:MAG: pentapeptide repeat-containing protein [Pirellulales bacterium]
MRPGAGGSATVWNTRKRRSPSRRHRAEERPAERFPSQPAPQKRPDPTRAFCEAELDGTNLAAMTIASDGNAFQGASFRHCKLEATALSGGVAAFQSARFDGADLARTNLAGGDCAFQEATFVRAALVGAMLTGGHCAFQAASFADADLTDATLTGDMCSFQNAAFDRAILRGAKLSGNFQGAARRRRAIRGGRPDRARTRRRHRLELRTPPDLRRPNAIPGRSRSEGAAVGGDEVTLVPM